MTLHQLGRKERDIEQAITALKRGAYLLKYGKRGKTKFCPFRLSNDESALIWISGKEEKHLRLRNVSEVRSGQRTPIFRRNPRPEKEYLSFSLISNNRSLDVICKDKDEAEVWFSGLKVLISRSHIQTRRSDTTIDDISSEATSPRNCSQLSSPLHPIPDRADVLQTDLEEYTIPESSSNSSLDKAFSDAAPKWIFCSASGSGSLYSASSGDTTGLKGHSEATGGDVLRVSLSSYMSSSIQGSVYDNGDSPGDVYMWGEGFWDDFKADCLLPQALKSAALLDVQRVACGGSYAALVTKQGEVFSWGVELGGRLGHGAHSDSLQPKPIDALNNTNVELVACGEYHTCAVSLSGDLYTWGDGSHNYGLLGHGDQASHWIPKRVRGPLENVPVSYISCGPWHTAAITSSGRLFTFGDGTFGALGHGDRLSVHQPREVLSLKGLRTVRASCGVWHTAAVVEGLAGYSGSSYTSGKLFTWGDGDKGRLGHGDKDSKLVPTCVSSLVDTNVCQVACGHSLTVVLSDSGKVYTMGSSVHGQLGNPQASGMNPTCVEGELSEVCVEEIACGAYHVAVLTSLNEVYTWGRGANGQLGLGDTDDRNSPALVEALKDKQVKSISCGTNFTAAVCLHKQISCFDQSICSDCRSPFNSKKRRRNCYHCGLTFCRACSDKKALKAAMAPNPKKPYRVCNNCFDKLSKSNESMHQGKVEPFQKGNKLDFPRGRNTSMESSNFVGRKLFQKNKKVDVINNDVSPNLAVDSQWEGLNISIISNPVFGTSTEKNSASAPGSTIVSRAVSPISRLPSPLRSTKSTPVSDGSIPSINENGDKQTNTSLYEEIEMLKAQVENLSQKVQLHEIELQKTRKELKEAISVATEETLKSKAAKEVIKSLSSQLKEVAERLPLSRSSNFPGFPLDSSITALDVTHNGTVEGLNIQTACQESGSDFSYSDSLSSRISVDGFQSLDQSKVNEPAPAASHGSSLKENKATSGNEWVKEDEPGVYITLMTVPGVERQLKRVRFSRKRFTEKQAEQWWAANHARVYEQYIV